MATPTDVARVLLARAVELRYDEPAPSGVDRSEGIEALGGRLEITAVFDDDRVPVAVGATTEATGEIVAKANNAANNGTGS
jgi:hypothetical protein